jgi:hypothetical protein
VVSLLGATLMFTLEDGDLQMGVNRVAQQRSQLESHCSFWRFLKSALQIDQPRCPARQIDVSNAC